MLVFCIFIEKNSNTGVFLSILCNFKNNYFEVHLWTAASNYGNVATFFEKIDYTE